VNGLCVGVSRFRERHKPQGPADIDKDLPHRPALDRVECFWMRSRGYRCEGSSKSAPGEDEVSSNLIRREP